MHFIFDLGTCSVLGLKTCERHHQSLPLLLLFKDTKSFISKRELMKLTYLALINAGLAWRKVSTKKTRFVLGSSRHCFDGILFIGESLYTSNNLSFARFRF